MHSTFFIAALAMVSIRRRTHREPTSRGIFYFSAVCTAVSAAPLLALAVARAGSMGAAGGGGYVGERGPVAADARLFLRPGRAGGAVYLFHRVVFAAIAGGVFWGGIPDFLSLAGALLVCLAGILTIRFAGKRLLPEVKPVRC